ncbi:RluA family pseudouridine synthase [Flexithrix dorotheae]|uniref:RluA family pseudouridine synthase n=1 Tax=Flexithrix dorotheae TaxID=70993 RepID=UPI000378B1B9|nr:RluA family pseudouridine synthase [Flexithrix dorotheae]
MEIIESHTVLTQDHPVRLSEYVIGIFDAITTRQGMKKAIKKGLVMVNGEVAETGRFLKGGEIISLCKPSVIPDQPIAELKLEVCYEDDYLAVIHKPAGVVVSGNQLKTIYNALPFNLVVSRQTDALSRPAPVHRLDFPTSGLLLVGKTSSTVVALSKMFEEKKMEKIYHAVTIGKMEKTGILNASIGGKMAETWFEVLKSVESARFGILNLVALKPLTGRRHQLRIHLSQLGQPILGDKDYGKPGLILKGKGLYLQASGLKFSHPVSGEILDFNLPLPKKFKKIFSL